MNAQRIIGIVRRIWVTTGALLLVATPVYAWWTYAPRLPDGSLVSDAGVLVERGDYLRFTPRRVTGRPGLLWVAGCLVPAEAYAPLGHAVAARGYPAVIYGLPWRCAPFPSQQARADADLRRLLLASPSRWVLGGHSKGAVFVSQIAATPPASLLGVIIAGSTHPRDVDLSRSALEIAKVVATADGIAPLDVSQSRRNLLPAGTAWHVIDGGNHSQFGWYGTQLGDGTARITRTQQHEQLLHAVLTVLARVETNGHGVKK